MRKGSLFAAFVAVAAFFLVAQVASAQYPNPKTTLVCAVNQVDIQTSSSATVAATLRDVSGAPLTGHTVKFAVVSGDADLSPSSASTDGSGTAVVDVHFGPNSGTVVISASSESSDCQASARVSGIVPPATGDAGLIESETSHAAMFAVAGIAAVVMAAGAYTASRIASQRA